MLARLADPHLAEREGELLDERTVHVLGQLLDRSVEPKPGLDAHGQKVESIRKLSADLLAPPAGLEGDEHVGREEADESE